jgi:hypothetical protein
VLMLAVTPKANAHLNVYIVKMLRKLFVMIFSHK